MDTKTCLKCQIPKPLDDFSRWKHSSDGRQTWCKVCHKTYGSIQKHREQNRVNKRKRRLDKEYRKREMACTIRSRIWNPEKYLWMSAKTRAKKYGILFTIEISDVIIPPLCPILKVEMISGTRYAPSLDKIKPDLGYIPGNVQVISLKANSMKLDATMDELKAFAEYYINF